MERGTESDADTARWPESCTLAIVMLNDFGHGSLPGSIPLSPSPSDTATFTSIWKAAKMVENECLLVGRRPGWQPVGTSSFHPHTSSASRLRL